MKLFYLIGTALLLTSLGLLGFASTHVVARSPFPTIGEAMAGRPR